MLMDQETYDRIWQEQLALSPVGFTNSNKGALGYLDRVFYSLVRTTLFLTVHFSVRFALTIFILMAQLVDLCLYLSRNCLGIWGLIHLMLRRRIGYMWWTDYFHRRHYVGALVVTPQSDVEPSDFPGEGITLGINEPDTDSVDSDETALPPFTNPPDALHNMTPAERRFVHDELRTRLRQFDDHDAGRTERFRTEIIEQINRWRDAVGEEGMIDDPLDHIHAEPIDPYARHVPDGFRVINIEELAFGDEWFHTSFSARMVDPSKMVRVARIYLTLMGYFQTRLKQRNGFHFASVLLNLSEALGITGNALIAFGTRVKDILSLVVEGTLQSVEPQSLGDWVDKGVSLGSKALKDNLPSIAKKLLALICSVAIVPALLVNKPGSLTRLVGTLLKKRVNNFDSIGDVMDIMSKMLSDAIDWLCGDNVPEACAEILKVSKKLRDIHRVYKLGMTDLMKCNWLQDFNGVHTALCAMYTENFLAQNFTVANALDRERELLEIARAHVNKLQYKACENTFSACLWGEPGIGKSIILEVVLSVVSHDTIGCEYDPSQIMHVGNTKHMDGLTNSTLAMIVDDVGASFLRGTPRNQAGTKDKLTELLINVCNPTPFTPHCAAVDDKGAVHPNIQTLMITANGPNRFGDIPCAGDPSAPARRVDYVEVTLLPEFQNEVGCLDLEKIKDCDLYDKNPWRFTVTTYDLAAAVAANADKSVNLFYPDLYKVHNGLENVGLPELAGWIRSKISHGKEDNSLVAGIMERTRLRTVASSTPISLNLGGEEAPIEAEAQALTPFGDFYHLRRASEWPIWVAGGSVGTDITTLATTMSGRGYFATLAYLLLVWLRIVWFTFGLVLARVTGNTSHGLRITLKVFCHTLAFNFTVIGSRHIVSRLSSGNFFSRVMGDFFDSMLRNYTYAPERVVQDIPQEVITRVRAGALVRGSRYRSYYRLHKVLLGGIFAGFSLMAIRKLLQYYRTCSDMKSLFSEQSEEGELQEQPVDTNEGIIDLRPRNNNHLFQARKSYTGAFGGKPVDMTRHGTVKPAHPTISDEQSVCMTQQALVRVRVEGVNDGDSEVAVPIGSVMQQYGMFICNNCNNAVLLVNDHAFNYECPYFRVTVLWKSGQPIPSFIVPYAAIASGSALGDLPVGGGFHGASDCALVEVPSTGTVPNILKLFGSELDFGIRAMPTFKRFLPHVYGGEYSHEEGFHLDSVDSRGLNECKYDSGTLESKVRTSLAGVGTGSKGECGLPFMSNRMIVAIHSAGARDTLILGTPLTREIIDKLLAQLQHLKNRGSVCVQPMSGNWMVADPVVCGGEALHALQEVSYIHRDSALQTAIGNSKYTIHGSLYEGGSKFATDFRISPKLDAVKIHVPFVGKLAKLYSPPRGSGYGTFEKMFRRTNTPIKREYFSFVKANRTMRDHFQNTFDGLVATRDTSFITGLGPCTVTEALNGFDTTLASSMNLNTSSGLIVGGQKNKYFDSIPDPVSGKSRIQFKDNEGARTIKRMVTVGMEKLKRGETLGLFSTVCFKDEVLEVERDEHGHRVVKPPRPIHVMDVALTIICRVYFLPVLAVMGTAAIKFGNFVGLDPASSFGDMYAFLGPPDKRKYLAMDYQSFDLRTPGDHIAAAIDLLIDMTRNMSGYTNEDRAAMKTLSWEFANPTYNFGGKLVGFSGSNSSGNPLTTIINCLVNHLLWNQMWCMWQHDTLYPAQAGKYHEMQGGPSDFYEEVACITFGDDVISSVAKDCAFSQSVAVYYAGKLGMVLTDWKKSLEVAEFEREIKFLKRAIHVHETIGGKDLVLAPLAMNSIFKPLAWGTWKVPLVEHYAGLVKSVLQELVQHGPIVYGEYVPQLRSLVKEFCVVHRTSDKREGVREGLDSYFTDYDFRAWEDRIVELYGEGMDQIVSDTPLIV